MNRDPQKIIRRFFGTEKVFEYKKDETIVRPDENDYIYYIQEGYVRLHIYSQEGKELTAVILDKRSLFPLNLCFENISNDYWFESICKATLYRSTAEEFRAFIRSDMGVFEQVMDNYILQCRAVIYRMQHIILGKAKNSVASTILVYANLLGRKKENEIVFNVPITHQHISFTSGLTRETTSIEMKKLELEGIIRYSGRRIVVIDLERLREQSFV